MRVVIRPLPPAGTRLVLGAGEVHVWEAPPARLAVAPSGEDTVLSRPERDRADRYRHDRARGQFVRCRVALRVLLGGYLGCPPAAVPIAYNPDGKPVLDPAAAGAFDRIHFNVSHTDGWAVFAVGRAAVGVDVELGRPVPNRDALVERFFAGAERDQYRSLPADLRPAAFLRGWTGKEAVLKGVGCGTRGLDRWAVDMDPRRPPAVVGRPPEGAEWAVRCWEPAPGYAAAVAVETPGEVDVVTASS